MSQSHSDKKNLIKSLADLFFVRVRISPTLVDDLRKYWKNKGINYRYVLELKDALNQAIKEDGNGEYLGYIRSGLSEKIEKSLYDYSMKLMIEKADNAIM